MRQIPVIIVHNTLITDKGDGVLTENKRIWEIDAFRGLCVVGMVAAHLLFDLDLEGILHNRAVAFLTRWGAVAFLALSGLCATLGKRPVRRGITVLLAGGLCFLVTYGMYRLGFLGKELIIYFGVLHCLGSCMLLWPVFRKLPTWALALFGTLFVAIGLYFQSINAHGWELTVPLGLPPAGFETGDYFPLLPNLGWFLLGGAMGRKLYPRKESLFPNAPSQNPVLRFFQACGRYALPIYLLHQPVFFLLLTLL